MFGPAIVKCTNKIRGFKLSEKYFLKMQVMMDLSDNIWLLNGLEQKNGFPVSHSVISE
jgi:hypothetical protein